MIVGIVTFWVVSCILIIGLGWDRLFGDHIK